MEADGDSVIPCGIYDAILQSMSATVSLRKCTDGDVGPIYGGATVFRCHW